jgi:hypothetical protein
MPLSSQNFRFGIRDPRSGYSGSGKNLFWIRDPGDKKAQDPGFRIRNTVRNPPDTFPFFTNPYPGLDCSPSPHCAAVSDDLLTAKEKNKKMEEEMEAAFQDIQNM